MSASVGKRCRIVRPREKGLGNVSAIEKERM